MGAMRDDLQLRACLGLEHGMSCDGLGGHLLLEEWVMICFAVS